MMSLIPMFVFTPSTLATKTPTSVLWGKLLLKTADRQAHNATRSSHCELVDQLFSAEKT